MLLFTIVWDTSGKGEVAKRSSAPASILESFNEIEGQKTCQNWVKNTILPNRPVFIPPQTTLSVNRHFRHFCRFRGSEVANPVSEKPCSMQKRPEPQICAKFVPAIVFGVPVRGREFVKFLTIPVPLAGTPKNNRWDKFRGVFACCKGKQGSQF